MDSQLIRSLFKCSKKVPGFTDYIINKIRNVKSQEEGERLKQTVELYIALKKSTKLKEKIISNKLT